MTNQELQQKMRFALSQVERDLMLETDAIHAAEVAMWYAKDFAKSELNSLLLEQCKIVIPGYREENWVPVRTVKEAKAKLEE